MVASENEGSRPSCEWKWDAQGDWEQQPFSPNHNPHGKAIENPGGLPKPSPRLWLRARSLQPKFRNFSGWTEPIHWVLDRNFQKFWSNGSRPKVPASKHASTIGSNACVDLGYGWTRARPSASTPTRMLPKTIKALHNPERCWQLSCSWSLTTLNYI